MSSYEPLKIDLLRHFLATLEYRFKHVTEAAPPGFGAFEAGADVRSPAHIVRHMTGLIEFAHEQFEAIEREKLEPLPWDQEKTRFLETLHRFDTVLCRGWQVRQDAVMNLAGVWQGPLLDAMTHIGQLATLRRLAGSPVAKTRYWQVAIHPRSNPG